MLSRFWSRPIVPLLIINSSLNQERTTSFLRQLQRINYQRAKAVGVVIEIDSHMPVQIDKISQFLQEVRSKHSLKIFGFCHSTVTLQSYYLLSKANEIYTHSSTIFQLQRGVRHFSSQQLLATFGIEKKTIKSDPNVIGNYMDSFTSANTSKFLNSKLTQIAQRIYSESIQHRREIKGKEIQETAPETMLGSQAIQKGYADHLGSYYDVLRTAYPECDIKHIKLKDKWSTRTLELLVASPIIIVLFLIKVLIKYCILMYVWLNHKKNKKQKQQK